MHSPSAHRRGFTLVELLVVIAIIGILASLITVAASSAITSAKQTRVKAELDQIAAAFKAYKVKYGSYPPNFNDTTAVRQHLLKAFPRISQQERDDILTLDLSPAEATWFWLVGFTPDPQRPVSGSAKGTSLFEFDETRLKSTRTETVNSKSIQLMVYTPSGSDLTEPYVYYDMSRNYSSGYVEYTDPDVPDVNGRVSPYPGVSDDFQVLAAGLDNHWGVTPKATFPGGPYIGNEADNLASFSTKNMEDSMP